jgi:hypothetical protein
VRWKPAELGELPVDDSDPPVWEQQQIWITQVAVLGNGRDSPPAEGLELRERPCGSVALVALRENVAQHRQRPGEEAVESIVCVVRRGGHGSELIEPLDRCSNGLLGVPADVGGCQGSAHERRFHQDGVSSPLLAEYDPWDGFEAVYARLLQCVENVGLVIDPRGVLCEAGDLDDECRLRAASEHEHDDVTRCAEAWCDEHEGDRLLDAARSKAEAFLVGTQERADAAHAVVSAAGDRAVTLTWRAARRTMRIGAKRTPRNASRLQPLPPWRISAWRIAPGWSSGTISTAVAKSGMCQCVVTSVSPSS